NPHLEIHTASAEALPFPDTTFDAVVANFAILHVGRPEQAVAEAVRVLRPGGRVALTTWDTPERMRLIGVLLDAAGEPGPPPPASLAAGPPFFRFAVDEQFPALLRDAGLTDATVRRIAFNHPVSEPGQLWDGLLAGTVRAAALVHSQDDTTRRRIRAAF